MTCCSSRSSSIIASAGGAVVILFAGIHMASQEPSASPDAGRQVEQDQPVQGGQMPDLIGGLRETPGVDAGRFMSGKQSIIAWFEDRDAVVRWYESDMHRGVMKSLAGGLPAEEPLRHVEDDSGPIMVIATLTMADRPHFESMPDLPISQISIELYKPLPGGAFLGERLAPESFEVPYMRDYTPDDVE